MTLQELAQELIAQASSLQHQIVLDDDTLGTTGVNQLIQSALAREAGNVLLIANPDSIPPDPPPTGFSFPCLLPAAADSFLNLLSNDCTVTFTQDVGQTIQFSLSINLSQVLGQPATWSFGDSFPLLLATPYEEMDFTAPFFIFTTAQTTIPQESFESGLNFTSPVNLTGPFASVGLLLEAAGKSASLGAMSGKVEPGELAPTIDINASLGIDSLHLFLFDLLDSEIGSRLVTTLDTDGETQLDFLLYVKGMVVLANHDGVEVRLLTMAMLGPDEGASSLVLSILPSTTFEASLEQLGGLVGGQVWGEFFTGPAAVLLPFLQTFGLRSYSLWLTLDPFAVSMSQLEVGTLQPWVILENRLVMNFFTVDWLLLHFAGGSVNQLALNGELQMFGKEDFIFDASILVQDPFQLNASFKSELPVSTFEWLNTVRKLFGITEELPRDITAALDDFKLSRRASRGSTCRRASGL